MKNLLLCVVFFAACHGPKPATSSTPDTGSTSTAPSQPGYLRFPNIPPFTLLGIDSTTFTRDALKKNRKTMIMYFSPGCEHCRQETDSLVKYIDQFRDTEILMATYQPYEEMKTFYNEKNLAKFPNIKMGYDTKYFFPPFYKMINLPFMALYNAKGQYITSFEGETAMPRILEAFSR